MDQKVFEDREENQDHLVPLASMDKRETKVPTDRLVQRVIVDPQVKPVRKVHKVCTDLLVWLESPENQENLANTVFKDQKVAQASVELWVHRVQ